MQPTPTSHTYFSQRLRLHYMDWGNAEAPTLLFVHGVHDHCRTWDDIAQTFCADYHVVAPDLRGHGDSDWVRGSSYHYLDYIYDLHQLIQQEQLGPVVLVGHSMGGAVAAMFAGVYPELVAKLIVIEGIGLWARTTSPLPIHEKIREWVAATRELAARLPRRYENLQSAYERMQHANPQLEKDQALHLTVHGSNRNEDGTYSWKYDNYTHNFTVFGISADDMTTLWTRIIAPVLVINASDGLQHRIGHGDTMSYFANAQLQVLEGVGHWTYHDDRSSVEGLIAGFLQDN